MEQEYDQNDEGSYIVKAMYPVPQFGKQCWDATRYYLQLGRYMNHAKSLNAKMTKPYFVRKKGTIGFVACRDIEAGDEVVWDNGVRGRS